METTWIIAADASRARVFQVLGRNRLISEIEDFVHQESRLKDREIRSDSQGRYYGKGQQTQGHSAPPRTDPSEYEAEVFSRTLSDYVDKARTQNRFDRLCIIAPPKFLGMMRTALSKEAQKLVAWEVPKDISWFDSRAIEGYIREASER